MERTYPNLPHWAILEKRIARASVEDPGDDCVTLALGLRRISGSNHRGHHRPFRCRPRILPCQMPMKVAPMGDVSTSPTPPPMARSWDRQPRLLRPP